MCGTPSHTIPQPQPWRVVQVVFGKVSCTHGAAGVNHENVILEVDVIIPYLEQHWGFTNLHRPELHRRLVYKNVPCNPGTGQPCQTASARLRPEELHTAGLRLVQLGARQFAVDLCKNSRPSMTDHHPSTVDSRCGPGIRRSSTMSSLRSSGWEFM